MIRLFLIGTLLAKMTLCAQQPPADRLLDGIVQREHDLLTLLAKHNPIIETYIQIQAAGEATEATKVAAIEKDIYFLGRMNLTGEIKYEPLLESEEPKRGG